MIDHGLMISSAFHSCSQSAGLLILGSEWIIEIAREALLM